MITSVKVKFRASRVSGKAGTIYYQLTHLRRTRCITTGIRLMPGEWDASAQRAVSPEPGRVPVWQCRIECDVDRLHRIIRDLGREGRPYTVDEVADRFCAQSCGVGVTAFMREQIAQLTADNRLGTARNYTRTLRSFSGFLGGGELPFAAFTERLVEEYNAYLLRRGVVRNTVSFYMRILRSVYNKAVRRRLAEPASPFGGVYTGVDRTRKRAIDERLIARLKSLDLPVSGALPLARDLFVFSYCMRGMAFVDMAFLRKKDMRDGAIHYVRRKTVSGRAELLQPSAEKARVAAGAGLRAFVLHLTSQLGDGGPQPQCAAAGDQRRNGAHLRAHDADLPLGAGNLGHRLRQPENPRFAEPLRLLLTCPEMRV